MQVGLQLCSKDWRNRMDALRALSALGPALPEVPNAALEGLLQALVGRLNDGNAKVNQKALEVRLPIVMSHDSSSPRAGRAFKAPSCDYWSSR
jgi:hypothetical protein